MGVRSHGFSYRLEFILFAAFYRRDRAMPKVDSMAIVSIEYDEKSRLLTVEIRNRNMTVSTYEYQDVPAMAYADFLAAESKGSFYNKYIRFGYKYSQKS